MRSKTLATLLSMVMVAFALATTVSAQGWKATEIDAGVDLAADFAVKEQADRAKSTITLNRVVKASDKMPKLGARDFMLCLDANVANKQMFVQAIVTMDQYSNLKLTGWSKSTCGGSGTRPVFKPTADYKAGDIGDIGADLASQNAIIQQEAKTKAKITFGEMIKVEYKEPKMGWADFRLCMSVVNNGKAGRAEVLISKDQYQNYKLTSWKDTNCGESADGFTKVEQFMAGVDLAADFAVKKHSEDTGKAHKLVEILKREEKGDADNLMAATYRICMKISEEGKTKIIQAIVSKDGYSNHKLVSWEHSKCTK